MLGRIDMDEILVLKHSVDGYHAIVAIFQTPTDPEALNLQYSKSPYFKNHKFEKVPFWMDVKEYIDRADTYMATWIRKEQDPEFAEYLRLKEKFA